VKKDNKKGKKKIIKTTKEDSNEDKEIESSQSNCVSIPFGMRTSE
jgi:hypothetical protein